MICKIKGTNVLSIIFNIKLTIHITFTIFIQNDAQFAYLNNSLLPLLSNGLGVEQTVSQAGLRRKETPTYSSKTDKFENTGSEASSPISGMSKSSTAGATKRSGSNTRNQGVPTDKKIPKWFKPGKPDPS